MEARLVDCIVNLPGKLFLNTQIPASLWFLSRDRSKTHPSTGSGQVFRNRIDEILFIDARNLGHLINRRTLEFTAEDIATISDTYHNWRNPSSPVGANACIEHSRDGRSPDGHTQTLYEDIPGFCNSVSLERVKELDYVLTPGRYVGLPDEEDDFDFAERFATLQQELAAQMEEENHLNALIYENLARVVNVDE